MPYYKLKEKEEKNINTVYTREIDREREREEEGKKLLLWIQIWNSRTKSKRIALEEALFPTYYYYYFVIKSKMPIFI